MTRSICGDRHEAIISRSKSGDAEAKCCSSICPGSTLCGAAIVVILSRVPWSVLKKDHAVAVSHHDATPLTSEKLVHHLRRRNLRKIALSYEAGELRRDIAARYKISVSSIGRLLRQWRAERDDVA